jgi:hypothetical protein
MLVIELVFQLFIGVSKFAQEPNIYETFVTLDILNEFKLDPPTRLAHPSNILLQLTGTIGDPKDPTLFKLAHPAKILALPATFIFNGPQLIMLNSFNLSPLSLNSHPRIVPVILMVFIGFKMPVEATNTLLNNTDVITQRPLPYAIPDQYALEDEKGSALEAFQFTPSVLHKIPKPPSRYGVRTNNPSA